MERTTRFRFGELTEEEEEALYQRALQQIAEGKVIAWEDFCKELREKYGINV